LTKTIDDYNVFMKILYLHGFNSAYDPNSAKLKTLEEISDLICPTYNTFGDAKDLEKELLAHVDEHEPDIIAGCSLGGYWAGRLSSKCNSLGVMINPSINPKVSLKRALGEHKNFVTGEKKVLTEEIIASYDSLLNYHADSGLVLLDMADELLDAYDSKKRLEPIYQVVTFDGGSHRFSHMKESLEHIENALFSYQNMIR
jgi:predicted esterase YcpF (UPF0227 family)